MMEVKELTKRFGEVTALHGVCLTVHTGSIFGLVGSNGAGKSTLLRILSGVYRPDGGEVLLEGRTPWKDAELRSRLRLLADEPWFPATYSILQMGRVLRTFYPTWDEPYFQYLCRAFPVNEKAKYGTLSKGGRKQAVLLTALASRPDFLLLDEVFDGLDPVVRRLLKKLLAEEVAERRMTVMLASHNLREMEDFCDTLALLHQGGVVLEKELDDLQLHLHRVQAVFKEVPEVSELKQKLCITTWERNGSLLTFVARGNEDEILDALDSFSPTFREALPLSLEEVFISEMEACGYDMENIL